MTSPPDGLDRRAFLGTIAAIPAALVAGQGVRSREALFTISLAEWSLHRTLQAGELDNLDFPATAGRVYGLDAVEYVNTFFQDHARDADYLRELRRRADDAGVRSLLIMCDGEGALGDPAAAARTQAVENHYRWVEAAAFLGCHSIRVNAQSAGTPDEQRRLAADGLRRLVEFAAPREINVIVENHGGISSNGAWLAGVIAAVDHPRCGTAVSAKSHDFDAQGNERHTNYRRMLKIVLDAGYRGYLGIEYEGDELSEADGIRATKALLERVRSELASEY
ncbi:MAG: TIM barrel protein [Gemmatimonadetes bacterium]|nr:TIM barrel protein [Gemmatimonadota bacterium]